MELKIIKYKPPITASKILATADLCGPWLTTLTRVTGVLSVS